MTPTQIARLTTIGLLAATTALPAAASAATKKPLSGTLALSAGKATKSGRAHYSGSYFRMILPGATDRYFSNPDSRAKDKTYTLLRPGTDDGLRLGAFQQPPSPAFAKNGDARAQRITRPEEFTGIRFSISTAPKDAQSGADSAAPKLFVTGSKITGDVRAWTAQWNSISFNQGAPKPNNSYPGFTRPVNGTYSSRTRAFEIVWYSSIVGGPFNGFTGYWHLQGKVRPS